jgi:anti-sigma factor RsiW
MAEQEEQYPTPAQLIDLSAMADGSLDPSRRQDVERWIAGSPHLRSLYEREQAAVQVLQQAAAERAPARLRMGVASLRASRPARARWYPSYRALAAALAAAAAALALLLPDGTPGSPSVSQAAQLALRGPAAPAPVPDPADPRIKLAQRLQGLYFPNWSGTLGWRPVGARSDRLGGRPAVTVYYQRRGMSLAYTIIGAPALAQPSVPVTHLAGAALQVFGLRGRTVVTWRRAGHTCVLSASAVPARVLEQLADWPVARITD